MTTTRTLCPLPDCGWHHDQPECDPSVLPQVTVDADVLASGDLAAISSAVTSATMTALLEQTESALREHLETHELIEWVRAVTGAQRRAEKAEQQVARIRVFLRDMAGWSFPRDIYAQRGLEILDEPGVEPG